MFRDNYTDFYYNDIHSKYYNVWITNNKDLTMNLSPNFSDKFVSPTFTQQRYYEGTTIDKQDLKLNMVAVNVTKAEWRAISQWLSPTSVGKFSFGWNKSHYYMVKPTSAPSGTIFVRNSRDHILEERYIVTFSITFTTTNDWAALSNVASIGLTTVENEESADITSGKTSANATERYKNNYNVPYVMPVTGDTTIQLTGSSSPSTTATYFGTYIECDFTSLTPANSDILYIYDNQVYDPSQGSQSTDPPYHYRIGSTNTGFYFEDKINSTSSAFSMTFDCIFKAGTRFVVPPMQSTDPSTTPPTISYNFSGTGSIKIENNNLYLCNPGSYNSYPNMIVDNVNGADNISFTLEDGNRQTYIDFASTDNEEHIVNVNGKAGMAFDRNVPLPAATNSDLTRIYSSDFTINQFTLQGGRPELFKGLIDKNGCYAGAETNGIIKVYIDHAPNTQRDKDFVLVLYRDINSDSNVYTEDAYSAKRYYSNSFEHITIINPTLVYNEEDGSLLIYGQANAYYADSKYYGGKINSIMSGGIVAWSDVYISLCDLESFNYSLESTNHAVIDMQTRDVI